MKKRYIAAIVLGLFAIPVGATLLGTFSSVVTAPGRVLTKTLDTNNIINNYEYYFDVQAQYKARKNQIEEFKVLAEDDRQARFELAAMRQTCRELAEQYNANSQKLNRGVFKDWSLPETLAAGECE